MIKICFITTISLTLKSFVMKTAEYIHENTDWDISFICSEDKEFADHLPEYIHFYPIHMERGISLAGVKAMFEMKRIFQREKFDLIQYSTPNASLYASLAGKLAGVPVRLYCQWGMAFVGFSGAKYKIFKTEEKLVCSLSTWIEPDSKSNLDFAHQEGLYPGNKGSVIGYGSACGVNLKKFDITKKNEYREAIRKIYGISNNAYVFGFVGRITKDKGVNELLQAFKNLCQHNKNVYLLMVGSQEAIESLKPELYQWSHTCKRVVYTGSTTAVEQYLSAMDCYVLPSYREGFGMGTIEAEAMGLPVIVTDIPGPIDAMIPNVTGVTVPKGDSIALQAAMKKMYEGVDSTYGEKGLEFITSRFEQKFLLQLILEDRRKLLNKE